MKRFLKALAIALAITTMLLPVTVFAFAPIGDINVPFGTPTVDGTLAQGEWSEKNKIVIDKNSATTEGWQGEIPDDFKIDFYYTWDATNLYFAANIFDAAVAYSDSGDNYNGDAFQLSLNLGQLFKTDEYDRAIFYSFGCLEDGTVDVFRQESMDNSVMDDLGFSKKTDTGWIFEIKMPWETLINDVVEKTDFAAPTIAAGLKIGVLICYLDREETGGGLVAASFTSKEEPGGWDPDIFGITLTLIDNASEPAPEETAAPTEDTTAPAETSPAAPETTTPAPQTSDMMPIAVAIVALGAAAVVFASKKK